MVDRMNPGNVERCKRLWTDPVIRKKMLAGSRKGAQARRNEAAFEKTERSYRCRRAMLEHWRKLREDSKD